MFQKSAAHADGEAECGMLHVLGLCGFCRVIQLKLSLLSRCIVWASYHIV